MSHFFARARGGFGDAAASAAAGLVVGSLFALVANHEAIAFLYLGALLFGVFRAGRATQRLGRASVIPWTAALVAAATRAAQPFLAANFYVDYVGPEGAQEVAFLGRTGGITGLYRALDTVVPVSSGLIFGVGIAASALATFLLVSAAAGEVRAGSFSEVWGRRRYQVAALLGCILAFDPVLVSLGASDAPHNLGFLLFALAVAAYHSRRPAGSRRSRFPWLPLASLALGGALLGFLRPELAPFVILVPFLGNRGAARSARASWVALPALVTGALAGMLAALSNSPAVSQAAWSGLTLERAGAWLEGLLPAYVHPDPNGLLSDHLGIAVLMALLLTAGLVRALRRSPKSAALAIAAYAVVNASRLGSDFVGGALQGDLALLRYDILYVPVFGYLAATGAVGLTEAIAWAVARRRPQMQRSTRAVTVGLIAAATVVTGVNGLRQTYPEPPFARELQCLRQALPALPAGSTIVAHRTHMLTGLTENELALPHPLLLFDRPDIRWVVLRSEEALPAKPGDPVYYFARATCAPETTDWAGARGYEAAVRRHITACSQLMERVAEWSDACPGETPGLGRLQ